MLLQSLCCLFPASAASKLQPPTNFVFNVAARLSAGKQTGNIDFMHNMAWPPEYQHAHALIGTHVAHLMV